MTKYFIYALIFLSCISCRTYKMLDGNSQAVYFTPDASVFSDSDFHDPAISYEDLLNIRGNAINVVGLKKGETSVAIIPQATFFNGYDNFLVYPGEHILIKKGKYNEFTFIKINGSSRRNRELLFFKTFSQIEHYPIPPTVNNASLDTILVLEKEQKSKIAQSEVENRQLFDSLTIAYDVSGKFKKLSVNYLTNRYKLSLFGLYETYKDTLQAHGLYREKCMQLSSIFNNINKPELTDDFIVLNELTNAVLPVKIHDIRNKKEFQSCFDFIENRYTGLARNYLLSQVMYWMYARRINVTSDYLQKYEIICSDKGYKKLINNIKSGQQQNDGKAIVAGGNSLVTVDGKKVVSLENIIAEHKGKLIVLDFWATWCAPCRKEMPYLKNLIQEYPEDKIVFLSISVEREIQPWQKFVIADNFKINNNFLMVDENKSSFMKKFDIGMIPRYMLIDQEGKVIDATAPDPSDPELKQLIDKNLD